LMFLAKGLEKSGVVLLIDTDNPESFTHPDLEIVKIIASRCEVLLGFGFTAESVEKVLEYTKVKGITMKGGNEIKPGIKDYDELADILERLELDD
jgi:phosphoribosylanthranilate isomerase